MKKATERKKFKMKKSVRLTIAGALAVTALVVALIPTKGVEATFDPSTADTVVPTLEDALDSDPFVVDKKVTADSTDSNRYWAYPALYVGEGDESAVDKETIDGVDYYTINEAGMGFGVVPVFEMSPATYPDTHGVISCIRKYIGGGDSGYTPQDNKLQLSPSLLIYEPSDTTTYPIEKKTHTGDPSDPEHKPFTFYRTTISKETVTNTSPMIELWGGNPDDTPPACYYKITKESWDVNWKHTPATETEPEKWEAPEDSWVDYTSDPTTKEEKNVLKKETPVFYISDNAFQGVKNIDTIELLSGKTGDASRPGITQIGDYSFADSTIKNVDFKGNFASIGKMAFYNCSELQSVNFNRTQYIGDGAFANCSALDNVCMPYVSKLGTAAFYGCERLTDNFPGLDHSENSRIFGGEASDAEIEIGSYAFCNCTSLTDTKMKRNTKSLSLHGKYGIYAGCSNLRQIELPSYNKSFQATSSMFLDCVNLECVRIDNGSTNNYTDSEGYGTFINNVNNEVVTKFKDKPSTVSDNFVIWGIDPTIPPGSTNNKAYEFAQKNTLPYVYWSNTENKFLYVMTIDDTYILSLLENDDGTFTIKKITEKKTGKCSETLMIPASIGGHPIKNIDNDACGQVSGSKYVSNLTLPTKIEISDAIASIGDNAFRNCTTVKEVVFTHVPFTTAAEKTSIGASCFEDCKNLEKIYFKDPDYSGSDAYYSINIDNESVGDRAFRTNGTKLTMVGNMEQGYWPYEYALNPENHFSDNANSYIQYESGNPDNIACKYSPELKRVSLLTYQTMNSIVDDETSPETTIKDLLDKYKNEGIDSLSGRQLEIIQNNIRKIVVPYGITSIENATNDLYSSDNKYFTNVNDDVSLFSLDGTPYDLTSIEFMSLNKLPDISTEAHESALESGGKPRKTFSESRGLSEIIFDSDIETIGELPFYNYPVDASNNEDLINPPLHTLSNVMFNGENDKSTATEDNPYYWCTNGIIYSYYVDSNGTPHTTIEEVLQSRGDSVGSPVVSPENDPDLIDVTDIEERAFKHCDYITVVDLSQSKKLDKIPKQCFYNCNKLGTISLPDSIDTVESEAFANNDKVLQHVYFYSTGIDIVSDAFHDTNGTYCHGYKNSSIKPYVDNVNKKEARPSADKLIFEEMTEPVYYTITFMDHLDMKELYTKTVKPGEDVATPDPPTHDGYDFTEWYSDPPKAWLNVQKSATVWARYTPTSTSSSSSSSSSKSTSSSGSSSSSSKSTSTSSSSKVSTSITSTTVQPVIISGTGTLVGSATSLKAAGNGTNTGSGNAGSTGSTGSTGNGSGSNVGKTKLISTTGGISDPSKMSATVNGSSDNYVIKISETDEANSMADQALTAAFGSLENIRYMPFDISLYDSTGNQKISPVPDGVSINITMPIPDKLAIYGGNAKVASTESGTLEKIPPKFTLINGVPCMNFTVTHLSPYVVYVDTANLTATGTLDSTPKTADPIHPKWFLVIGLAAISGILFLKRDKKETFEAA